MGQAKQRGTYEQRRAAAVAPVERAVKFEAAKRALQEERYEREEAERLAAKDARRKEAHRRLGGRTALPPTHTMILAAALAGMGAFASHTEPPKGRRG